jgi:UDP-GlcNAc:undecaprenyl-phosphate/decaprenyl-phosphate GlcNAc-1-phosphate transferase
VTPRVEALIIVGVVTTAVTFGATPLCRRLALRTGVIVAPDERRVHERPTPLLGGLAMGLGLLAGLLVASRLDALADIFAGSPPIEPLGLLVASLLMLLVGTVDDIREVSPPAKTAGIVLCASVLVFAGIYLGFVRLPVLGVFILDSNWAYLLSVVWVYGMTNATNWIDGLDGLAAGIIGIAAASFLLYTVRLGEQGTLDAGNMAPVLAVIMVGLCAGFLPFNFHPARIFMGDGGALLLGLLMAAATMMVGGRIADVPTAPGETVFFFFFPLFVPLLILGVPIVDVVLSIGRRLVSGKNLATADKDHIHHRLMRLGHGQRRSVGILWGWTFLLSALALYRTAAVIPVALGAVGLVVYTVLPSRGRRRRRSDDEGAPPDAAGREEVAEPGGDAPRRPPPDPPVGGAVPTGPERAGLPAVDRPPVTPR